MKIPSHRLKGCSPTPAFAPSQFTVSIILTGRNTDFGEKKIVCFRF